MIRHVFWFDFIECITTTFMRAHSWINWVDTNQVGNARGLSCAG